MKKVKQLINGLLFYFDLSFFIGYEEREYINKLWSDIDTTEEIGGPYYLSDEKALSWFEKMVDPTDGRIFIVLYLIKLMNQ